MQGQSDLLRRFAQVVTMRSAPKTGPTKERAADWQIGSSSLLLERRYLQLQAVQLALLSSCLDSSYNESMMNVRYEEGSRFDFLIKVSCDV